MTKEQRTALGETIIFTAEYYGRPLTRPIVSMMIDDLSDLIFDEVIQAYKQYRRNEKNKSFPLPAQIRAMVQEQENPEASAREAAARIIDAVGKYGWNNPTRAQNYIGSLGWEVVMRAGGWVNICQTLSFDNVATIQAQLRELGLVLYSKARFGNDSAPALPTHSKKEVGLQPLSAVFKTEKK